MLFFEVNVIFPNKTNYNKQQKWRNAYMDII